MKHDWEYKKLGEVSCYPNKRISLSELNPQQFVGVETLVKDKGGVSFSETLPNADVAIEFIQNDILVGNIRPYLKKIWMSDRIGGASGDVINIRINDEYKDLLKPSFLYKVLSSDKFFDYDNANTHGAKMPRGDRNAIAEYTVPIPPLPTQQSIVSELDSLSQIIADCKETLKDYDALEQSIFYDMFGDPVKNDKGWKVRLMKDVAPNVKYQKEIESFDGKFWLLNLDMIQQQTGEIIDYIYEELESIGNSTTAFSQEYVLYSKLRPYLNKVVLPIKSGYCTSELIPLLPDSKCLNKYYLAHLLRHKSFVEFINIKVAGAKMPRVSMNDFWGFSVILPPLPLQQQFASKIEAIEQMKSETKKALQEAETLFNARMDYWFN